MSRAKALLVSDDASLISVVRKSVAEIPNLGLATARVLSATAEPLGRDGIAMTLIHQREGEPFDAALGWIQRNSAAKHAPATVVISDRHNARDALALLRGGVAEYLARPLNLPRLSYLLDSLTLKARSQARAKSAAEAGPAFESLETAGSPFFYSPCGKMGRMMAQIQRVASSDASLLIEGETGSGKTHVARIVHELSPRRAEPFVVVNCGSLSATLIESELFGHVKGAFTSAERDRVGKLADVGGGTLLLDDADSLPLELQPKLLRTLDERVFEPVGSNRSQPLKARVIIASNRPLAAEVAAGRFRADLFYRVSVIAFTIPPLRDRLAIVPQLARSFAAQFTGTCDDEAPEIDEAVFSALESHDWPGNIRELRNVIERAVALCEGGRISLHDLPDALLNGPIDGGLDLDRLGDGGAVDLPTSLGRTDRAHLATARDAVERDRIMHALFKHANNRVRAAEELGISRMTLYNKLRKHGLTSLGESVSMG